MGAAFLAYHKDGNQTLRVQLKGRLTISKRYRCKDLYLCFPHQGDWFLVPHNTLVGISGATTNWLNTPSWESGQYSKVC